MPDRIAETRRDPLVPKQSCSMCFKTYCDLYWGCRKRPCKHCLIKFSDCIADDISIDNLINENEYESQLFSDWMVRNNKTLQEVFTECLNQARNRNYGAGTVANADILDKIVCQSCSIKLFRDLAYQYRRDIPETDFFSNLNLKLNYLLIVM